MASNTVTATITAAPALAKRQGLVPATEIIASCTESLSPQNASLISAVSSACTCIFATPDTVTVSTTVINVRQPKKVLCLSTHILSTDENRKWYRLPTDNRDD